MNLEKLSPVPWEVHDGGRSDHTICRCFENDTCSPLFERCGPIDLYDTTDADFIVLARTAFDVMMRRFANQFGIIGAVFDGQEMTHNQRKEMIGHLIKLGRIDTFTMIVEADEWYTENVEKKCASPSTSA